MKRTHTQPEIPIVFEDDHLLVIKKPVNVLSQADHTGDPDVVTLCKTYLTRSQNNPFVGLVHRLDRPVGGLMLLGKSRSAADALSQQMRDRTMQKTYWAITEGSPPPNGMLTHHLKKDRTNNIVEIVEPNSRDGKEAILSFARLEESDQLNLLAVHLQTGRPHQIRVQLAEEGYPIWGDYKYGSNQPDGRDMALRAVELRFQHPKLGQQLHFELAPNTNPPWNQFSIAHS